MAFQAGESKRAQHRGREKSEVASSGMVGSWLKAFAVSLSE